MVFRRWYIRVPFICRSLSLSSDGFLCNFLSRFPYLISDNNCPIHVQDQLRPLLFKLVPLSRLFSLSLFLFSSLIFTSVFFLVSFHWHHPPEHIALSPLTHSIALSFISLSLSRICISWRHETLPAAHDSFLFHLLTLRHCFISLSLPALVSNNNNKKAFLTR